MNLPPTFNALAECWLTLTQDLILRPLLVPLVPFCGHRSSLWRVERIQLMV